MKAIKVICNILSTLLLIALVALAGLVLVPRIMGYQEMAVLSGSMEPNIHVGSVVFVDDDVDPSSLETGDVVTYYLDEDTFVTHRVQSIDTASQTLVTKGDNNNADDGDISFSQIFGKAVFWVPYLGYLTIYMKTPVGIMAITVAIVLIILLNFLPMILSAEDDKESAGKGKRAGKRESD